MNRLIIMALILVSGAVSLVACRKASASFQVGGIYSTADGNGGYGVAKILAHESGSYHLRVYYQEFQSRPTTVDLDSLLRGSMGHYPMKEASFLQLQPVLITNTPVTADELDHYNNRKEDGLGPM